MRDVRYEVPLPGVARVVLSRPESRNAQTPALLAELDRALLRAASDDDIAVIVLAGDGPDFSSGHDLRGPFCLEEPPVATMETGTGPGIEGHYSFECEAYLGLSRRWRDLPKPTIAEVQGRSIAGALMLIWPMDLVVAAESATFSDPVTVFGVNGVEYFVHAWELGARKAKELLFTGEAITSHEAHRLGMVNRVVPDDELADEVLRLAERISRRPRFGLRLAKQSVNASLDAQGLPQAVDAAFALHNLGHANNLVRHGQLVEPAGGLVIRTESS